MLRWPAPLLAPVQARLRRQGVLATVPITLSIVVRASSPRRASDSLADRGRGPTRCSFYRGSDLFHGALWRLPASALLAQSWCNG